MKTIDRRLPLERHAIQHAPCGECSKAVFPKDFCRRGFCAETNSIIYAQGGRTCPWWADRATA